MVTKLKPKTVRINFKLLVVIFHFSLLIFKLIESYSAKLKAVYRSALGGEINFKLLIIIFHFSLLIFNLLPSEASAALISKPPTNLGLVGYWSMNEGAGTVAGDGSGNGNRGTLTNGPTWVDGKRGKALNFDGVDDEVKVADSSSLVFNDISMSAWFKVTSNGDLQELFRQDICSGTRDLYGMRMTTAGIFDVLLSRDTTIDSVSTIGARLDNGTWHHIVGVGNVGVGLKVYIDRVLNNTASDASTGSIDSAATFLRIGKSGDCGTPNQDFFNGSIDEVRIYNRVLTPAEIKRLYNMGR